MQGRTALSKFFLPVLFLLCIFLVFNRHSKSRFRDYHSVSWADAAGYYVYLPSTFIYDFNPALFPDSVEALTGGGFKLDLENQKVITKYNYGVALLQTPFFLTAHAIAPLFGVERSGYNPVYFRSILIAGVVYLFLGFLFLRAFLRRRGIQSPDIEVSLLVVFGATNLFFYSINSPGFSHIYSFFLFSGFIYFCDRFYLSKRNYDLILLSLFFAIAVLVRLTNVIAILFFIFYNLDSVADRVRFFLKNLKVPLVIVLSLGLVFLPQFVYWKWVSGSSITYMYGEEGFSNLSSPKIAELLFSTYNGWILYNPVVLLLLFAAVHQGIKRRMEGLSITLMILIAIYCFSSWYAWHYGCSYGSRPFSEYMAFLVIPFSGFLSELRKPARITVLILVTALIIFNINTIYHYDGCWYGGTWDWKEFLRIILR